MSVPPSHIIITRLSLFPSMQTLKRTDSLAVISMIRSARLAGQLPLNTVAKLPLLSRSASPSVAQQNLSFRAANPFRNSAALSSRRQEAAVRRSFTRPMASNGEKPFRPQNQEEQPGREHEMDPIPDTHYKEYLPAGKLKGKVAIITGGDSGIGKAIAKLYSLEGASVAITYVPGKEEKDAEETLDLIRKCKTEGAKDPIKIGVDIGYDENCQKVVNETLKHFGQINIVINNAAQQHQAQNFEDIDPKQVEEVFRTNIFSHFYLSKHSLKHMKAGDSIICTTSINAYKGNPSLIDYTSTKGAIVAFVRGLALHVVDRGIRVNGVAPGPIWTPLIPATFPEQKVENFGLQVPMKRAGSPQEVATAYVFLASEDASYYTGQVLHPNGGMIVNA